MPAFFAWALGAVMVQHALSQGTCQRIARCALGVADWHWPLAQRHGPEIARDWQRRRQEAPRLFDGKVYLFRDYRIDDGALAGTLFETDFKTLLYWRALPFAASDHVREASGAALIRSAEGHLLFGRQSAGQLNSGRVYPPSGVIDGGDVADGSVNVDATILRELIEETGLSGTDLRRGPGYLAALVGVHVAIGVEWSSDLPAEELRGRILRFIAGQTEPELDEIVIVRELAQCADERMPPHARLFAAALLGGR